MSRTRHARYLAALRKDGSYQSERPKTFAEKRRLMHEVAIGATFLDRSEEEEEKDEVERWDERIAVASKLGVGQRVKERERESEKRRNDGGRWTVR